MLASSKTGDILAKLILNVIVSMFDFVLDTKVGIDLQENHPIWSTMTFGLIFLPGIVVGLSACFSYKRIRRDLHLQNIRNANVNFGVYFYVIISISTIAFPIGILIVQTIEIAILILDKSELINPANFMSTGMMGLEAFVESGPQTILQF